MALRVTVEPEHPEPKRIAEVAARLRRGEVCAMPTDTVYGLAANAGDAAAVAEVFAIKGRDFHKPLPLMVRDLEQALRLTLAPPALFRRLAAAFWPGPLTLIVTAGPGLASAVTAGTGTVGMRQPGAALARALLAAVEFPLTATSANRSGEPECLTADAVELQLGERLGCIVDGGAATSRATSTIVDLTGGGARLVRAGAIPIAALAQLCTLEGLSS